MTATRSAIPDLSVRIAAEPAGDLVAIDARQADVHQHDLRTKSPDCLNRKAAVVGDLYFVCFELQDRRQALCRQHVVVNDQNTARAA